METLPKFPAFHPAEFGFQVNINSYLLDCSMDFKNASTSITGANSLKFLPSICLLIVSTLGEMTSCTKKRTPSKRQNIVLWTSEKVGNSPQNQLKAGRNGQPFQSSGNQPKE